MTHRCLTELDPDTPAFYLTAQRYGNALWQKGFAGRALLALTRALYCELSPDAAVYQAWPLPYRALAWILHQHPSHDFPGNPRISFQHQATRIRGPRHPLLRSRAWAVWALACKAKPDLPGDTRNPVTEPSPEWIAQQLETHGHPHEAALWLQVLKSESHPKPARQQSPPPTKPDQS